MLLGRLFPCIIWSGDRRIPSIYLTFDDGPDPAYTPKLLQILKNQNVSATFFLIGSRVERHPELVRRMVSDGHLVGNHSYSHLRMVFRPKCFLESEITKTNRAIKKAAGQNPCLFRPPYGRFGIGVLALCKKQCLRLALWNLMSYDYKQSVSAESILQRIDRRITNGRIILLHDSEKTVTILPELIRRLKNRGFHFMTLDSIKI